MTPHESVGWILDTFEGGFVDHPDDTGGPTNHGITIQTLSEARGQSVSRGDIHALSRNEAVEILTRVYAEQPGYIRIVHPWVQLAVIDFAIHSGPRTATKALQRAVGTIPDGLFGPITERSVNEATAFALEKALISARLAHWAQIFQRDHSQRVFAAGWLSRMAQLVERQA
jgi:lysozyme family protein|tara:strand:+ start:178 stop:690 length:513 start_codon:yes stop_codon:yes gene_type:complete